MAQRMSLYKQWLQRVDSVLGISPGNAAISPKAFCWFVFLAALLLRLAFLFVFHVYPGVPIEHLDDPEARHFARSLIERGDFTNPYVPDAHLPSAHRAPLHPVILAGAYALLGDMKAGFHFLVYFFLILASALGCVLIYLAVRRRLDERIARVASILLVLYPGSVYYSCNSIGDPGFVAVALCGVILTAIYLADKATLCSAVCFGVVTGLAALLNPNTLSVACGLSLSAVFANKDRSKLRRQSGLVMLAWLIATVIVMPWLVRNRLAFDEWVFIRCNFGMEFLAAHRSEGNYHIFAEAFPLNEPAEADRLRKLGEVGYSKDCFLRAREWIKESPLRFARLTAIRFVYFWADQVYTGDLKFLTPILIGSFHAMGFCGIVLALRRRERALVFLIPILLYPCIYYITHVQARYRFPIDTFLLVFAAYFLVELVDCFSRRLKTCSSIDVELHSR